MVTEIRATQYELIPDTIDAGTRGSYGEDKIALSFDDFWDGLNIKIVFYPQRGKPITKTYLGGEIIIPAEVMRYDGESKFVVSGLKSEGDHLERKIVSLPGKINIRFTLDDKGGNETTITPDTFDQFLEQAEEYVDQAITDAMGGSVQTALEIAKESGLFDAKIEIGTVTEGNNPSVTNTGTPNDAVFNFTIPRGSAASVAVDGATALDADSDPRVVNVGTTSNARLHFYIPRGHDGSGSVSSVKVNGVVKNPTGGIVDIGSVVTDISTKADLVDGKVPQSQLPSYVDDVVEYANRSLFPASGEAGKIYVDTNTNLTYRWGGTGYVEISPSLALGETSATAYRGDRGKTAYDHSQATTGNPHHVTYEQLGGTKPVYSAAEVGADSKGRITVSNVDSSTQSEMMVRFTTDQQAVGANGYITLILEEGG